MGRKAKSAALKKIAEWTSILSGREPTSTENGKQSDSENENRTPLNAKSQNTIKTVKNYSVRINKLSLLRMQISNVNLLPKLAPKR